MNRMNGLVLLLITISAVPVTGAFSQDGPKEGSAGAVTPESSSAYLNSDPRRAAEAYMKAALEGRVDDAIGLAKPGSSGVHDIELIGKIGKLLGGKLPVIETVLVSEQANEALALFTLPTLEKPLPGWPNGERILLILARIRGGWFVSGLEIGNEFAATELNGILSAWPRMTLDWMPKGWGLSPVGSAATAYPLTGYAPPQWASSGTQRGGATPATVPAQPPSGSSPQLAVKAYVKAALDGRIDAAVALAESGSSTASRRTIEEFGEILGGELPALETVYLSDNTDAAIVLTSLFPLKKPQPDGQNKGRLLFTLARIGGAWVVNDVDIETDASAAKEVTEFQQRNPYASVEQLLTGPRSTRSETTTLTIPMPYRFHVGDEIHFECGADPKLDRVLTVLPDGTITLPSLGQRKATGLTIGELREQLEEAYEEYYTSPSITVTATPFEKTPELRWPGGGEPSPSLVGAVFPPNRFVRILTGKANLPGEPGYTERGNIIVSWSKNGDAAWGYSKTLGKWTKQEIQPPAKDEPSIVLSDNIALFRSGRSFYGYSGQTGKWDQLTLPQEWKQGSCPVYDDTVVLTVEDNIYTFANATGRWSSRDGSSVDPTETTPDGVATSTPQLTALRASYDRLRQEAARLVTKHKDAPEESQSPDVPPALKGDLSKLVQQAFEARQELQRAELAVFRRRLDALEKQIDDRDRLQTEIVERRVDELLRPAVRWEGDEAADNEWTPARGGNEVTDNEWAPVPEQERNDGPAP